MTRLTIDQTAARIRSGGVVAIIRGKFTTQYVLTIADAMAEAGLAAMEVTLNSPDAAAHIAAAAKHVGDRLLVGAGTVRTPGDVDTAIAAGAQFLISPGFDPDSVKRSREKGMLHLPGVYTASEAQQAFNLGCRMQKLFPADQISPAYLKALRAPLHDIDFVPTGGVGVDNIAAWRKAGAAAVAVGTSLVASADHTPEELLNRAEALSAAWKASA
jgi:2-dehydro-3-deoxyphosphogluconate aldolase/(4S)-4-hydroxy-2-oxoglutarate aldolase